MSKLDLLAGNLGVQLCQGSFGRLQKLSGTPCDKSLPLLAEFLNAKRNYVSSLEVPRLWLLS